MQIICFNNEVCHNSSNMHPSICKIKFELYNQFDLKRPRFKLAYSRIEPQYEYTNLIFTYEEQVCFKV